MRKILTLAILFCLAIGSTFAVSERIPDFPGYEAELTDYYSEDWPYEEFKETMNEYVNSDDILNGAEFVKKPSKFQERLVVNTLNLYETKAGEVYEFCIKGPNEAYSFVAYIIEDNRCHYYLFVEKE